MNTMTNMRKFLFTFMLMFIVACNTVQYSMYNDINGYYNLNQIDSICSVEKIPSTFCVWDSFVMRDYESKSPLIQYFYRVNEDSIESVYTVTRMNKEYQFKKRVTKKLQNK